MNTYSVTCYNLIALFGFIWCSVSIFERAKGVQGTCALRFAWWYTGMIILSEENLKRQEAWLHHLKVQDLGQLPLKALTWRVFSIFWGKQTQDTFALQWRGLIFWLGFRTYGTFYEQFRTIRNMWQKTGGLDPADAQEMKASNPSDVKLEIN